MNPDFTTPEMCQQCYWRLSRCEIPKEAVCCQYFEPWDREDELTEDLEYSVQEETSAWEQAGYEVFESAYQLAMYYKNRG